MDAAEFPKTLTLLVDAVREVDPAFADRLAKEGTDPDRVRSMLEGWSAEYGRRDPLWVYSQFSIAASHALENGLIALAAETEAAFVAYAEGVTDLSKTPEEHHAALERIWDEGRAEAFAALVARVEALGAKAGLRVRHAGFVRALDRGVPNPNFTTEYRAPHGENAGETAAAGALVGTAMMPIVGTVIGGAAGWLGGKFLHGKAAEPSLERQKAQIVYTAGQVRAKLEEVDVSEVADEQMPYAGPAPSPDEAFRMLTLFNAVGKFLPVGGD